MRDRVLPETERIFCAAAETYLAAYLGLPPSLRSPQAVRLDLEWDHVTVVDFYPVLGAAKTALQSIGTWTPYEVEALQAFYLGRGETGHHLTPQDWQVLTERAAASGPEAATEEVRALTHVGVDYGVIDNHRNVLV